MYVKLEEIVHFQVTTHSPSGGFAKNADSIPKFSVFEEDTDAAIIEASGMTLRTGRVGVYRGLFPASVANGFESQKWYSVLVSGIVEGISAQDTPLTFFVENNSFDSLASTTGIIRQNLDKTGYGLSSGVIQADVVRLNNIPASGHNGVFDAYLADTPMGGAAFILTAKQVKITGNNLGDGSFSITNTGSGPGIKSTGGNNFAGGQFVGGNDAHGILGVGVGLGHGFNGQGGVDGGNGANFIGLYTGHGLQATGGVSGVDFKGGMTLASGEYSYYADIRFDRDTTNSQNEYTCTWFRNTTLMGSGQIGSPQIQVIKTSDGTDLIAVANMNYISMNTGTTRYNETTNVITLGESYIVKCTASIDSQTRTWQRLISRDG